MDKTIEKNFKKYLLEVDDAIESHGFKASSYIDFAENNILELQLSTQKAFKENHDNLLFKNLLETSLNDTIYTIVKHTYEDAQTRENYTTEQLEKKTNHLHEDLKFLNTRLLNSFNIS